ncbi:hypothetical protein AWB81_07391 [Caballeronia arationis]|nr:hypothetical protein AWB81_07391 [Caballeronia arationis]
MASPTYPYNMRVSVTLSTGTRELLREYFQFNSEHFDREAVLNDGRQQFLALLQERLKRDAGLNQRIGHVRYRIRGSDLRAL